MKRLAVLAAVLTLVACKRAGDGADTMADSAMAAPEMAPAPADTGMMRDTMKADTVMKKEP